jgi:hypothetical protein
VKLLDVPLRQLCVNERLLLLGWKSSVPLEDLGIDPSGQSWGRNTKADAEVHLLGQISVYAEQAGRLSVYVSSFIEEPHQIVITPQMSQYAELRLGVVGFDEDVAGGRHEEVP